MTKILTILAIICMCSVSFVLADELVIKTKNFDVVPGDGIMDAGTPQNPYVIQNPYGKTIGKIQTKNFDVQPGDGLMDAGTPQNPYIIKFQKPSSIFSLTRTIIT